MKVTIHISHAAGDDLSVLQAMALSMGFDVTAHEGFMGRQHTELTAHLTESDLQRMLEASAEGTFAAA